MLMDKLVIGTRRSRLALLQADIAATALRSRFEGLAVEVRPIDTEGDRILDKPLAAIDDKGLFTRAIEARLLDGSVDIAVHSLKDLPTDLPNGLSLGAVLMREASEDVLVGKAGLTLETLESGARVGTSSVRRMAQLRRCRPDVKALDIRGNVETRLGKLDKGEYDALILACAGLNRLQLEARIACVLPADRWYIAVGQGALAIEIRANDERIADLIRPLNHAPTRTATDAERAFLHVLGGGCQAPAGVWTQFENGNLSIKGMVAGLWGTPFIEAEERGAQRDAAAIGERLAQRILDKGGAEVLQTLRQNHENR